MVAVKSGKVRSVLGAVGSRRGTWEGLLDVFWMTVICVLSVTKFIEHLELILGGYNLPEWQWSRVAQEGRRLGSSIFTDERIDLIWILRTIQRYWL